MTPFSYFLQNFDFCQCYDHLNFFLNSSYKVLLPQNFDKKYSEKNKEIYFITN